MDWTTNDIPDLTGRIAVVTGANRGLGFEVTRELARKGAHVVMACRSLPRAEAARRTILGEIPHASLELQETDLASLVSVRAAANRILAGHDRVDLLVNNAGVMAIPEQRTVDGFEMQLAVNHLGHFALMALLLPALLRSPDARVVSVTSTARLLARPLDPRNPHLVGRYGPWKSYGQAKLATVHFALELDRRFREAMRTLWKVSERETGTPPDIWSSPDSYFRSEDTWHECGCTPEGGRFRRHGSRSHGRLRPPERKGGNWMTESAIEAEGLVKTFGKGNVRALDGIDMVAREGTVFGLLGPNGAGKTTAIRVLSTLLYPDAGRASVGGYDVMHHPERVRGMIGLTGQYAAVDELLSGRENLFMIGRLLGLPAPSARTRATELLEAFDLSDAGPKYVKTYSGGMRRRLDLAASLVGRPRFLYLDEPTTGLDPRSRLELWGMIRALVADGTTVLLTTQYLEEADKLADEIVVIDHGRVIAAGTPAQLKTRVGGHVLQAQPADPADLPATQGVLASLAQDGDEPYTDGQLVSLRIDDSSALGHAVRRLDDAGIAIDDLSLRRPSLDEVFLAITGHLAEDEAEVDEEEREGSRR
ncbi:MAG: SDR family NAD(P)-dependent oxidoreductase [Actinomycetota bacterium]